MTVDLSASPDLVLDRLAQNVSKYSSKKLFSFLGSGPDGGKVQKSFTYESFSSETSKLAQRLHESGLKRGDRALLVYPPSLDFMVAFFACLKVGVVAVPVFPPNPARKDTLRMFTKITESCGARFALTSMEYNHLKKLAKVKDSLTKFKNSVDGWPDQLEWIATDDKKTAKGTFNEDEQSFDKQDLAFLQYTSGSTSEPKGVMITHGNLAHNLTIITKELKAGEDTIVTSWLPQYHDMGLIGSYLGIAYCGGTGYYMSPLSFLQRPMLWVEAMSKYQATHCQAPNFAFKLTSRKFQASNYADKPFNLSSLRHIINAAEPVDEESMQAFYKSFTPFGLNYVIFPTYGLAEHTVFVCSGGKQIISVVKEKLEIDGKVVLSESQSSNDSSISRLVGCGFPTRQGVDVRIVDRETQLEMAENVVGEIWVDSPSKAAGYYLKKSETKEDFQAVLQAENEKTFLRTGDLGFFHNGELFICGRLKDLIIVGGRNFYPQDLEMTAETTSIQFRPGCSAAFSIDPTGNGGEEVALIMELRVVPGANDIQQVCNPLADQVRAAINQEHSLGISEIIFLQTKTVPKTTSGKIARSWCRKAFLAGTLKVVFRKSFRQETASFEIEGTQSTMRQKALTKEEIQKLRDMSRKEIKDKLRDDLVKIGQISPDDIDDNTALVTVLDSMSLFQFKGTLESSYAVQISDEYLLGETVSLSKLAEVVKLGHAEDDTGVNGSPTTTSTAVAQTGKADGLAGALGCPPGVVCCIIQ